VTGVATLIGTIVTPALANSAQYGFDFNPVVDRIRVVNSANENLRINPNTGLLAGDDPNLTFTPPATGPVTGVAYDRNFAGTTLATLFGIDRGLTKRLFRVSCGCPPHLVACPRLTAPGSLLPVLVKSSAG